MHTLQLSFSITLFLEDSTIHYKILFALRFIIKQYFYTTDKHILSLLTNVKILKFGFTPISTNWFRNWMKKWWKREYNRWVRWVRSSWAKLIKIIQILRGCEKLKYNEVRSEDTLLSIYCPGFFRLRWSDSFRMLAT